MSMIPSSNSLEDSLALPQVSGENPSLLSSDVDWSETPKDHVLKANMAGMNNSGVKVEVEGVKVLQISGEKNMQREEKSESRHRVECRTGKFMRSFTLPANARVDQVRASMENGVLTVTVPKQEMDTNAISN